MGRINLFIRPTIYYLYSKKSVYFPPRLLDRLDLLEPEDLDEPLDELLIDDLLDDLFDDLMDDLFEDLFERLILELFLEELLLFDIELLLLRLEFPLLTPDLSDLRRSELTLPELLLDLFLPE